MTDERHPRSRWFDWVPIVLIAVLAVVSYGALRTSERTNHNAASIFTLTRQLHQAALGECHRVQHLRNRVNANSETLRSIDHLLINVVGERSLLASLDSKDRALRVAAVRQARVLLSQFAWQPPTDCVRAVEHPLAYKPPPDRAFGP